MLNVIKFKKAYINGTEGCACAAVVFNSVTKKVTSFVQWGGENHRGHYIDSGYHMSFFASFAEAEKFLNAWAEQALGNH